MDVSKSLVRASVTFALLAVFIVFYVQPKDSLPVPLDFVLVLAIEVAAFAMQRLVSRRVPGFLSFTVRLVVTAFLTAVFVAVALGSTLGLDGTFVVIWGIEVAGFLVAELGTGTAAGWGVAAR